MLNSIGAAGQVLEKPNTTSARKVWSAFHNISNFPTHMSMRAAILHLANEINTLQNIASEEQMIVPCVCFVVADFPRHYFNVVANSCSYESDSYLCGFFKFEATD